MFTVPAWLVDHFYGWTHNYAIALAMIALAVMLLITPLTLKSTKGMLEMQRLQPEMKKLQNQYRNDRQKLNEEMMKLYQEHKVNPLASCLPLLAQMPVFIIMFRVIHGLTYIPAGQTTFHPKYISASSELYKSLVGKTEMRAFGLDLAARPSAIMGESLTKGIPYALLIVGLAGLFFIQQRMVASRSPQASMSAGQAKVMQYMPVAFAIFQVFLPTGLVIYYATQAVVRIVQQWYITRRFYGEGGLGHVAREASERAKDMKADDAKPAKLGKHKDEQSQAPSKIQSKRVTAPKDRPAPSGRAPRPTPPSKRNK